MLFHTCMQMALAKCPFHWACLFPKALLLFVLQLVVSKLQSHNRIVHEIAMHVTGCETWSETGPTGSLDSSLGTWPFHLFDANDNYSH